MQNKTLESLKFFEGTTLFQMEYYGDYGFDEFLKVGVSSDAELRDYIVSNIMSGRNMDYSMPNMGCSTFSARIKDGNKIFGRNFDQVKCLKMVVTTRPRNGYASMSVVNLSHIGIGEDDLPLSDEKKHFLLAAPYVPLDGVNEKGLAVGVLFIGQAPTNQNRGKTGITTTTFIRMILDKCENVTEAVEMLAQYDMHSSANADFHFQISDRFGSSVVVEYVDNEMQIIESPCATNFLLTPGAEVGDGHDRFEILENALVEKGGEFCDTAEAMMVLKAVSGEFTRWSAVYDQNAVSLLLSSDTDYENFFEFSLYRDSDRQDSNPAL